MDEQKTSKNLPHEYHAKRHAKRMQSEEYREKERKRKADYFVKHRAEIYERKKRWREKNRAREHEQMRKWRLENLDWIHLCQFIIREKRRELYKVDAAAYAEAREKNRKYQAERKRRINPNIGEYKPHKQRQIPDYMVFGECSLRRGTMLFNCYDKEQLMSHKMHKFDNARCKK